MHKLPSSPSPHYTFLGSVVCPRPFDRAQSASDHCTQRTEHPYQAYGHQRPSFSEQGRQQRREQDAMVGTRRSARSALFTPRRNTTTSGFPRVGRTLPPALPRKAMAKYTTRRLLESNDRRILPSLPRLSLPHHPPPSPSLKPQTEPDPLPLRLRGKGRNSRSTSRPKIRARLKERRRRRRKATRPGSRSGTAFRLLLRVGRRV